LSRDPVSTSVQQIVDLHPGSRCATRANDGPGRDIAETAALEHSPPFAGGDAGLAQEIDGS